MTHESHREGRDWTERVVRTVLAVGILALGLGLFSPFVSPFLWAAVLSYAMYPLYTGLRRATGERRTLSALIMCVVLTAGVIVPLLYLSLLIAEDLTSGYRTLVASLMDGDQPFLEAWRRYPLLASLAEAVQQLERLTGTNVRMNMAGTLADVGRVLVEQVTRLTTHALAALVQLGMMLLCAFYLFRDGDALVAWLRAALPIEPERQVMLAGRFDDVVKGAVYGNTVIALSEGLLGGLAFWAVGLPSAVLWGAVMALLAYLPLVGAGLVWIPAAAYLFWTGAYLKTGVLVAFGGVIAVVDYLVRTIVVGGRSRLHTLLVFFSVLGGLQWFGLIGIVVGPLIVAVGITLVDSDRIRPPAVVTRGSAGDTRCDKARREGAGTE